MRSNVNFGHPKWAPVTGVTWKFLPPKKLPPGNDTIWQTFPLKEYHMANLPPEEIPWQNFPRGETIPYGKASPSMVNLPPTQIAL